MLAQLLTQHAADLAEIPRYVAQFGVYDRLLDQWVSGQFRVYEREEGLVIQVNGVELECRTLPDLIAHLQPAPTIHPFPSTPSAAD
ncbi:MAG: hypothetical protein K0S99_558 [Thermomicrobiales bacterium]|jgi:hypothetical protein|nr:hypothetical protein [Thermomicrobiales bacterium]